MSIKQILTVALCSPGIKPGDWNLPVLFWGAPGIGKTAIVTETCLSFGSRSFVLSPGEMGDGAFGVVPVPLQTERGTRLMYPQPEWVDDLGNDGVLFLDELSSAPPHLHPPLLGLLLEKRIGGAKLAPTVRVVGAANPVEDAANGFELAKPTLNRMGHFQWPAQEVDTFRNYLSAKNWQAVRHVKDEELVKIRDAQRAAVLANYSAHWAVAQALVGNFLRVKPTLKNVVPQTVRGFVDYAYPTDRSWDMTACAIAGALAHGYTFEIIDLLVAGFVGSGVATEFAAFRLQLDLPDPADVLDGKIPFTHNPNRLDRSYAILDSCAALVRSPACANRKPRADRLWKLLEGLSDSAPDIALRPAKTLIDSGFIHTSVTGKFAGFVAAVK